LGREEWRRRRQGKKADGRRCGGERGLQARSPRPDQARGRDRQGGGSIGGRPWRPRQAPSGCGGFSGGDAPLAVSLPDARPNPDVRARTQRFAAPRPAVMERRAQPAPRLFSHASLRRAKRRVWADASTPRLATAFQRTAAAIENASGELHAPAMPRALKRRNRWRAGRVARRGKTARSPIRQSWRPRRAKLGVRAEIRCTLPRTRPTLGADERGSLQTPRAEIPQIPTAIAVSLRRGPYSARSGYLARIPPPEIARSCPSALRARTDTKAAAHLKCAAARELRGVEENNATKARLFRREHDGRFI
jgi:hypothetical protein